MKTKNFKKEPVINMTNIVVKVKIQSFDHEYLTPAPLLSQTISEQRYLLLINNHPDRYLQYLYNRNRNHTSIKIEVVNKYGET